MPGQSLCIERKFQKRKVGVDLATVRKKEPGAGRRVPATANHEKYASRIAEVGMNQRQVVFVEAYALPTSNAKITHRGHPVTGTGFGFRDSLLELKPVSVGQ